MSEKNNGGPAFPIETTATPYAPGMTLRDYAEIAAMAAILSNSAAWSGGGVDWVVKTAKEAADAMLEARK